MSDVSRPLTVEEQFTKDFFEQRKQLISEEAYDHQLVVRTSFLMREKLALAREKGRGGWWNPDECDIGALRSLLESHVRKGDMTDVINLAAMIKLRELMEHEE